jgi:hypothetical protein
MPSVGHPEFSTTLTDVTSYDQIGIPHCCKSEGTRLDQVYEVGEIGSDP